MANKEVWISVAIVVVLLALGVFLTQKTTWFESSYNSSDYASFDDFGEGIVVDVQSDNVLSAPSLDECVGDGDCVADSCCHATACVAKENAIDCSGKMCTLDCKPGTMDCGQGSCLCADGKCAVKMAS